jgi:hypothetical protein
VLKCKQLNSQQAPSERRYLGKFEEISASLPALLFVEYAHHRTHIVSTEVSAGEMPVVVVFVGTAYSVQCSDFHHLCYY